MPEYLAPGVFDEEAPLDGHPIAGVPTTPLGAPPTTRSRIPWLLAATSVLYAMWRRRRSAARATAVRPPQPARP